MSARTGGARTAVAVAVTFAFAILLGLRGENGRRLDLPVRIRHTLMPGRVTSSQLVMQRSLPRRENLRELFRRHSSYPGSDPEGELKAMPSNKRMALSSLPSSELDNKVVLVRADLNVHLMAGDDRILNDQRIKNLMPTINHLMERNAKIVVIGHVDRRTYEGRTPASLAPVAGKISELLAEPVTFAADTVGETAREVVAELAPGSVAVLENVRLAGDDEGGDEELAAALASMADIFVMDDFVDAHLNLASTVGIANRVKTSVMGLLCEKEVKFLDEALNDPQRPFAAIVGGAKLSTKADLISRLIDSADSIFIGGAIANTFMVSRGLRVAQSLYEPDMLQVCKRLELKARNKGVKLLLPDDFIYSEGYDNNVLTGYVKYTDCYPTGLLPMSMMALDIADHSLETLVSTYKSARTVFWNGPVGAAELEKFSWGSKCVAMLVSTLGKNNRTTIVGGKDTIDVVEKAGVQDDISHCSTGGASFMDIVEKKILPGLTCLNPAGDMRVAPLPDDAPLFDVDAELEPVEAGERDMGANDVFN
mmetsp:Transcript_4810/g.9381  ORF Transcript_4810/g.9381 Transcript_4810/m.9381 type:complete len:537 (+) Transcript_4810:2-1612(+)